MDAFERDIYEREIERLYRVIDSLNDAYDRLSKKLDIYEHRCELKPGDQVVMKNGGDKVFNVISDPWMLCGEPYIALDGVMGGFPVRELTKLNRGG